MYCIIIDKERRRDPLTLTTECQTVPDSKYGTSVRPRLVSPLGTYDGGLTLCQVLYIQLVR